MPVLNNPHDDSELAAIRSSQEDPLVQYYIVRKSLDMSAGKIGAQCAHAAQIFMLHYMGMIKEFATVGPHGGWRHNEFKKIQKWLDGSFRKVVLKARDSKFEKVKEELNCFVVKDAGLTQVETGSETVLVLFPVKKSEAPALIQRLRVL